MNTGLHTFPKGIWPNMNVIAQQEFELAYYDSPAQRFNHYTTKTYPISNLLKQHKCEQIISIR